MIWDIMKKQALIFWRNPTVLIMLLAIPMLLIVILSISLGSFFNSGEQDLDIKIGMIDEGDAGEQLNKLEQLLDEKDISQKEQQAIIQGAEALDFVTIFREDVLADIEDTVELKTIEPSEKHAVLKDKDFSAVIEVSDDFLLNTWQNVFLEEGEAGTWNIDYNQEKTMEVIAAEEIVSKFQKQMTLHQYAVEEEKDSESLFGSIENFGTQQTIDGNNVIEAKEYYAIGMVVMNVLFMASSISSFAFVEKERHIFNRIILADIPGSIYFIGVFFAATVFAFIQMLLIFGFAWIAFDVTWPKVGDFLCITAALASAVGGLAVLLSIIAYRVKSETIINMFGSVVVSVLAFIGGSFFPIGNLSDFFRILGNYTPNGAAMTAFLELLKGNEGLDIWQHVFVLIGFAILFLAISIGMYPKRGQLL